MRIGLDVMGGDNAPDAILEGAIGSLSTLGKNDEIVLVGDAAVIKKYVSDRNVDDARLAIVGCTEVIGMGESPVEAVRSKKDASVVVLARLAGRKAAKPLDAMISAGNTGAFVAAAQMFLRRLPAVHRPGIAVTLPTFAGPVTLIDVGANLEPKPHHLAQYGVMGEIYAGLGLSGRKPRVALMNVGGEEQKGTGHIKEARDLLREDSSIDFIGYVEGRGVFNAEADVVITDAIVGNVMLKLAEGLSAGIFRAIGREIQEIDPELAKRFEPVIKRIYAKHDYHEYGGAPLLGVAGICLICHGSSVGRTISSAVAQAKRFVESGLNETITDRLGAMRTAIA